MEELNSKLQTYKLPILLSLLGIVLILGGVFSSDLVNFKKPVQAQNFPRESLVSATKFTEIKLDISGAVNNPAVYSLPADSRVEDAIKTAGGFSPSANADYIAKNINLSQKLTDGQKIYVPFEGENLGGVTGAGPQSSGSPVNINSASQSDLEALPGIGPSSAQKIISGRPYTSVNDLTAKKIVTKAVFGKIQSQITAN